MTRGRGRTDAARRRGGVKRNGEIFMISPLLSYRVGVMSRRASEALSSVRRHGQNSYTARKEAVAPSALLSDSMSIFPSAMDMVIMKNE